MTTYFEHITSVATNEIVLTKDGNIVLNKKGYKKQTIGNYKVEYPRDEAKRRGLIAREYVPRVFSGGIPYKCQEFAYSSKDFKVSLCNTINSKGIEVEK